MSDDDKYIHYRGFTQGLWFDKIYIYYVCDTSMLNNKMIRAF